MRKRSRLERDLGKLLRTLLLAAMAVCLIWLAAIPHAAAALERRVALIIGNSKYSPIRSLKNPVEDAAAMTVALQRLGFRIIVGLDLSLADFRAKMAEFEKDLKGADLALLFYAGHGVQYNGHNYLLPTDIELKSQSDVISKSIALNVLVDSMARQAKVSLIFLDACRDSPQIPVRSSFGVVASIWNFSRGLAPLQESAADRFVAYAAAPGLTALDGQGKHSPFAQALLRHVATQGQDINTTFSLVRRDVLTATNNRQQPEATNALTRPLVLNPGGAMIALRQEPVPYESEEGQPTIALSSDVEFWMGIRDSSDPKHYEEYLRQNPNGRFVNLARRKLDELKTSPPSKDAATKARPANPDPPGDGEDHISVRASGKLSQMHPKVEAERSVRALARARAIAARTRIYSSTLPSTVSSSTQAAELLAYLAHGIPHDEHWTLIPSGADTDGVEVELRAKVRALKPPSARKLSGSIEPTKVVADQPFRLKVHAKREAQVGVFAWQADGTILRLYPAPSGRELVIKAGETVSLPRANDPFPAFSSANMPGEKRNHEAIIVVTGSAPMKFDAIVPNTVAREVQTSLAMRSEEFLNRLAAIVDPDIELLIIPYEVLQAH